MKLHPKPIKYSRNKWLQRKVQASDKEVAKDNILRGFRLRHYLITRRAKLGMTQAIRLQVALVHIFLYQLMIHMRSVQYKIIPNWRQS